MCDQVLAQLLCRAKPPATRVSRCVNNRDSEISNLDVGGVTSIRAEREGESEKAKRLADGLQIENRAIRQASLDSYLACEILGGFETFWRIAGRTCGVREDIAFDQKIHLAR